MTWRRVLGRVSFANCDPIFDGLEEKWKILPAPPAWLTGHVLRKDCLTAPIPAADYANYCEDLQLIPGLGIVSQGDVGSVLLFGNRSINSMRDIALPSDSSTSKELLKWVLKLRGLDPKFNETGPDIDAMLNESDGALLIGDKALLAADKYPNLIKLDLGAEWTMITGYPMVFGVFATRKDSPIKDIIKARRAMLNQYENFLSNPERQNEVITNTAEKIGFSESRVRKYFHTEVRNSLDDRSTKGLELFLQEVCGMTEPISWVEL